MSAQVAEESDSTSGGVIERLLKVFYPGFDMLSDREREDIIDDWQFTVRKCAHFSAYTLLGILITSALEMSTYPKSGKGLLSVFAVSSGGGLLYAISDEIHQYYVPGRSCEVRDMAIDFSGVILGSALVMIIILLYRRGNKRKTQKTDNYHIEK